MCGCGGKSNLREFEYVPKDGPIKTVTSQAEAIKLVRENGGTWRIKAKA